MIPEHAIEAAVKAWDHHWGDRYGDEALDEMGEEVRVALTAAAPFIAAKALEDAADGFQNRSDIFLATMQNMVGQPDYTSDDIIRYGAYSGEANTAAATLRRRAESIRSTP